MIDIWIAALAIYCSAGLAMGLLSLRCWRERQDGRLAFLLLPIQGACGYTRTSRSLTGWVAERDGLPLVAAYLIAHALGWPLRVVVNIVLIVGLLATAMLMRGWEKINDLLPSRRRNRRVTKPASPPAAAPLPRNRRRNVREVWLAKSVKSRIAELREEFLKARIARDRAEAQMEVIRQCLAEIGAKLGEDIS